MMPANNEDKIERFVENGLEDAEDLSPMDPPEPYELPNAETLDAATLPKALKNLYEEHVAYLDVLSKFEKAFCDYRENGWTMTPAVSQGLKGFFEFTDQKVRDHNRKEEKALFPILHERFMASGEHSPGVNPITPIDIMEDDHLTVLQAANLVFNLLGIAAKLRDLGSRITLLEHAYEEARSIVETMKLHIYKENNVIFPLAMKLLTASEMENVHDVMTGKKSSNFLV